MRIRGVMQRWLVVVVVCLIVLLAACGAAQAPADEGMVEEMPDGKALMEDRCTKCHNLDRVVSATKTEAEWQASVERMIEKGAVLDAAETVTLVAYLSETYGP